MFQKLQDSRAVLLGAVAIFAIGLTTSGYALGDGLRRSKMAEHRIVSVRGVSERNVTADLATWTVDFSHQGTDFGSIQQSVDAQAQAVRAFFRRAGFRPDEISDSDVSVTREQPRDKDGQPVGPLRLTVKRSIQLRTSNVMRLRAAYAAQSELLREGVEVSGTNANYTFTKLNALKPRDDRRGDAECPPKRRGICPRQRHFGRTDQDRQPGLFLGWSARWRRVRRLRCERRRFALPEGPGRDLGGLRTRLARLCRCGLGFHGRRDTQHLNGLGGSLADRAVGIAGGSPRPIAARRNHHRR